MLVMLSKYYKMVKLFGKILFGVLPIWKFALSLQASFETYQKVDARTIKQNQHKLTENYSYTN